MPAATGYRGFTLIEVVLAIAVGLIIIAGVSVGYSYAKRAAIMDNQRKNVAFVKTWVEQAIVANQANLGSGGSNQPPLFTQDQLASVANSLPSLRIDPYNGATRVAGCLGCPGNGSCFHAITQAYNFNPIPIGPTLESWTPNCGSALFYFPADSYQSQINVTRADGSTATFFGYVVAESDPDGNIVAAEGGNSPAIQATPPPAP